MPLEKWGYSSKRFVNTLVNLSKYSFDLFLRVLLFIWKCASPYVLGSRCRFTPTCSEYAVTIIKERGLLAGGFLALKRLSRCHPLGKMDD